MAINVEPGISSRSSSSRFASSSTPIIAMPVTFPSGRLRLATRDPADDGIPDSLRRCSHCGRGDGVERWDLSGRAVWLHEACTSSWRQ